MKYKHLVSIILVIVIVYGIISVSIHDNVLLGIITDLPFQPFNLVFLLIPFGKAYVDVFWFEKKGKEVKHKNSMLVTIMVSSVLVGFDSLISGVSYFQSAGLALGYFFLFFDYVRNLFAGKEISYVDDGSKEDSVEDSWFDRNVYSHFDPLSLLFVKLFVFLCAVSCYYLLTLIIG